MAKKYADIDIQVTVQFEDDGSNLKDQAIEAADDIISSIDPRLMGMEVVGEVRETELPK